MELFLTIFPYKVHVLSKKLNFFFILDFFKKLNICLIHLPFLLRKAVIIKFDGIVVTFLLRKW